MEYYWQIYCQILHNKGNTEQKPFSYVLVEHDIAICIKPLVCTQTFWCVWARLSYNVRVHSWQ